MFIADVLIVHISQKLETTSMSISKRMDKQCVVYSHNGIINTYKIREQTANTHNHKEYRPCDYIFMKFENNLN